MEGMIRLQERMEQTMIYKAFQDLKLSALGMGCMRLPVVDGKDDQVDQAAVEEMVACAMSNGVNYYIELYRHDVPATLHVYPSGGHGWGNRDSFKYHNEMQLELKAWLRSF